MRWMLIAGTIFVFITASTAFSWEYTTTFDTDPQWTYFDDDTGAGTAITQEAWAGVLSVSYPNIEWRYIFVDGNSPGFGSDYNLSGGYVQSTLRWTGDAPSLAFFFFAGGGDAGDDQIYVSGEPGSYEGGSQTFWMSKTALTIGEDWTDTGEVSLDLDSFSRFNVGTVHNDQRGDPDTWTESIQNVDAVGILLGYFGGTTGTLEIDEFTVTPEPSILLLSGPLAGFLGWRIRRRGRRTAAKA